MTRDESLEVIVHDALVECNYKCQGILDKNLLKQTEKLCPEKHGEHAINYKGRVVLLPFFHKKEVEMLCWKCLQKAEDSKKERKKGKKKPDPNQIDAFGMPNQKKHKGPKSVPATSKAAHNISKKSSVTMDKKAYNLVRKAPNRTAWELLKMSIDFLDVYDLRRCLTRLKSENKLFNPAERKCKIKKTKMFTWRTV